MSQKNISPKNLKPTLSQHAIRTRNRRWNSLGSLALAVKQKLEEGNEMAAWRLCTEVIDDEHAAFNKETLQFVNQYPLPSGNLRADAIVAALREWICSRKDLPCPEWLTETRICKPFWFINPLPSFQLSSINESHPSFASRGIFLNEVDLTTA